MKYKKILKFCFIVLLLAFMCSYFLFSNGYYEYYLSKRKSLTNDQIKMFEEDVKSGKEIDIKSYLEDNEYDYSTKLTKTVSEVNLKLNNYLVKIIGSTLKMLGKLVN